MIISEKISLSIDRIDFSFAKNLSYNADAHSIIDEIRGKAIHIDDESGKESIAGELTANQINLADILNDGSSIHMTLDEHSYQLTEFASFFSDNEKVFSKKVFKTFNIEEDEFIYGDDDVLIFDNLYVNKEFRGKNVGQLLIEATCNDFRRKGRFAFLKAYPLQFSGEDGFDNFSDEKKEQVIKEKKEFQDRSFKVSQDKLINLYKKCGFNLISGEKEFMVMDLHERDY